MASNLDSGKLGRDALADYVQKQLLGPSDGNSETVEGRLSLKYMLGRLFPRGKKPSELNIEEATDDGASVPTSAKPGDGDSSVEDDPLSLALEELPSSVGISFCVPPKYVLVITASAARYEATGEKGTWRRVQLQEPERRISSDDKDSAPIAIWGGSASLHVIRRVAAGSSNIVTVSLLNSQVAKSRGDIDEKTLFQVAMRCSLEAGSIPPYPSPDPALLSEEDREALLLYSRGRPFAIGHGASASWEGTADAAKYVEVDFMPRQHVWRPVFDVKELSRSGGGSRVLSIPFYANQSTPRGDAIAELEGLCAAYSSWIDELEKEKVDQALAGAAGNLIKRARSCSERMIGGVRLLRTNDTVWECFQLANRAMLMQMCRAQHVREERRKAREIDAPWPPERDTISIPDIDYISQVSHRWRPFQIAFLLQVLRSLVDDVPKEEAEKAAHEREIADVLWFSTGGGKTEAYLLVAAFEMLRRRLAVGKRGGGTAVISRYTYRFLTAEQFERTAGLVCALEMLRKADPKRLGSERFTVGLWAGGAVTPNNFSKAFEVMGEILAAEQPRQLNKFQIEACPYCGTGLLPSKQTIDPDGDAIKLAYGFNAQPGSFSVYCPTAICPFNGGLPVGMVDDALYKEPPTFLIGTIDKFARVAWESRTGRFLGSKDYLPPSLVIQDELHLISGPLGTVAAIYEAALDTVMRNKGSGRQFKVIGSTATIQNAASQVRRLFGRPVSVFPPQGLDAGDSFFSRADHSEDRARLYVGLMGQGIRSTVAFTWACAAILQGVRELELAGKLKPSEADVYWTMLAYHNSIRELGRTSSAAGDEIPTRMKVYASTEQALRSPIHKLEISSGAVTSISDARQQLAAAHTTAAPGVDLVPCTNMISVGIDVDRLGLMVVNGQPKLTSEYIQATSRVGRRDLLPGIVFTAYSPSKPRDRSHYEGFRAYHMSMHREVEPTSVTPGSIPATERALHAALVIVMRHAAGLSANNAAAKFAPHEVLHAGLIDALRARLLSAYSSGDPEERQIDEMMKRRVEEWNEWTAELTAYEAQPPMRGLLWNFGKQRGPIGWEVLQSMRTVDADIELEA